MNSITRQSTPAVDPGTFRSEANHDVTLSEDLAPHDRHLLFRSTLGLYLRRANHHIPVTASDLIRLMPYVDPDPEEEGHAA